MFENAIQEGNKLSTFIGWEGGLSISLVSIQLINLKINKKNLKLKNLREI